MYKAFFLFGFIASIALSQGCGGGKKEVASAPTSSVPASYNGGQSSSSAGSNESSSNAEMAPASPNSSEGGGYNPYAGRANQGTSGGYPGESGGYPGESGGYPGGVGAIQEVRVGKATQEATVKEGRRDIGLPGSETTHKIKGPVMAMGHQEDQALAGPVGRFLHQ